MDTKKKKDIDEKLESWINLAYGIQAGFDSPENYPKEFQEWYAERTKKGGDAYRERTRKVIEEQQKRKAKK